MHIIQGSMTDKEAEEQKRLAKKLTDRNHNHEGKHEGSKVKTNIQHQPFKDWHKDNLLFLLEVAEKYFPEELSKILDTYTDIRKGD